MRRYMIAVFLCALAGSARAGGVREVVDQSYIPVTGEGFNTSASVNLPLGQEFTPTRRALDFVNLYIGDAGSDIGPGASFKVNIREGSITGTILGTSNTTFVPDNTNLGVDLYQNFTVTHFTFSAPVMLTPGQTDVIEVVQLPPIVVGNFNFIDYGGPLNASTYPGGRAIVNGTAMPNFDFAFVEGVTVPEPSSLALVGAFGAFGGCFLAWRKRGQVRRLESAR